MGKRVESLKVILLLCLPLTINDFFIAALRESHPVLLWGLDLVWSLACPLLLLLWFYRKGSVTLDEMGLSVRIRIKDLLLGALLAIFLLATIERGIGPWLTHHFPQRYHNGYPFPKGDPMHTILVIYASVTAGVFEEIVYRGVITSKLENLVKRPSLVFLLSCAIFAGIHWGNGLGSIAGIFLWAILPTLWFMKKRTVWGLIVCHITYDLVVFS